MKRLGWALVLFLLLGLPALSQPHPGPQKAEQSQAVVPDAKPEGKAPASNETNHRLITRSSTKSSVDNSVRCLGVLAKTSL
jgi:hypothetical protein